MWLVRTTMVRVWMGMCRSKPKTRIGGNPKMLQEFKQHLTSETTYSCTCRCHIMSPFPTQTLIWFLGRFLRRRKLVEDWRFVLTHVDCMSRWFFVKQDVVIAHLRRGKPGMNHKPRLRWRDSWSDLLYAKTLLTAGDFLTLPLIVHLRRGRPDNDSYLDPLMTIRSLCLLAISMCSLVV